MPCIEDWLTNPLSVAEGIFYETGKPDHERVREFFSSRLQENEALQRVPSLNDIPCHLLKSKSLVRFRCMIQDMFDPEFFLAVFEAMNKADNTSHLRCGMYQDMIGSPDNFEVMLESARNVTKERQTFYCVPIPGETDWAKKKFAGKNVASKGHEIAGEQSSGMKRGHDDEMDQDENDQLGVVSDPSHAETKRARAGETAGSSTDLPGPQTADLNFPLSNDKGPACLVHLYEQESSFKVNDMVEFIGILSADPSLAALLDHQKEDSPELVGPCPDDLITPEEKAVHHPPPSLVPRLHCLTYRSLTHSNPCVPHGIKGESSSQLMGQLAGVRGEILSLLTQIAYGDSLTAEYILLHLVSSVYNWSGIMPVGKFALNISGCPTSQSFPQELYKFVEQVVPKCHFLSMTLKNMNSLTFVPQKDYTANRLKSGLLQLSESTNLMVDETALEAGQLDGNGVKNVTALGSVISWQKLEYDFNFYKAEFTTNLLVLVLSEGKSLLPSDCHVVLRPQGQLQPAQMALESVNPDTLERMQIFLGLARVAEYSLSAEMQEVLQNDFVNSRQQNHSSMSVEDFHLLLLLSRLMALSCGQTSLTPEMWNRVKQMEAERRARLVSNSSN